MKKLNLKLNGIQPMSKDDMKKISGGDKFYCIAFFSGDPQIVWVTAPDGAVAQAYCNYVCEHEISNCSNCLCTPTPWVDCC